MYEDRRTILPTGLLSERTKPTYVPKKITFQFNDALKPKPNHINRDKEKLEAERRYREQMSKGGGSVICTELKRLGIMSPDLYEHAHMGKSVSQIILNGYHLWAVPYVEAMRRWILPSMIAAPLALAWAKHRAHHIAPNLYPKENWLGMAVHYIGGSICFALGLCIPIKTKWQSLYTGRNEGYPWPTR